MARLIKGGDDFTETNSMIAKFAFLLLVLIAFLFLVSLGIKLLSYFLAPPSTTYLIYGMITGQTATTITQDPNDRNSITIWRSNNEKTGIEFTWLCWLNVTNLGNSNNVYQHVFNKGGNGNYAQNTFTPGAAINNAPGVYINPNTNTLRVIMDVDYSTSIQQNPAYIDIENIPLKKWFHVAVRLENTLLDVYINGTIAGRLQMTNVPKQNYDNVYVCSGASNGFSGYLSNLEYLNYAADVFKLNSIVSGGPNTYTSSKMAITNTDYLSSEWYNTKL